MKLRKGYVPFVLALFGLMAGCTRTLYVPTRPEAALLHKCNRQLAGKQANLVLAGSGREVSVENVHIAADGISYFDSTTGSVNRVLPTNVQKITVRDHGLGALQGAGLGLLIGTAAFLATFMIDPFTALFYSAPVGAPLVLTSTVTGAAVGSKRVYIIGDNPNSKAGK